MRRDDPEVSRYTVSTLHLHQVAHHHLLRVDLHLLTLPHYEGLLWEGHGHLMKSLPLLFLLLLSPLSFNPTEEGEKPLAAKLGPGVET